MARDVWSSTFGFLYAAAAAAIGLGTLWRFPYVAGANGGGLFVLLYIFFVFLLCVPLMIAEMSIGRRGPCQAPSKAVELASGSTSAPWGGWKKMVGWLKCAHPLSSA
ncbi:hypothetical protein [Steroidobacter cummioxidans]|uniref:hypothetical protein n=1 Tax=Steroidobacter cummioxidans TaxID=1803913 RepID=UPI00137A6314|nr:hypothetical protein [Steroidobacter cummioxidans]